MKLAWLLKKICEEFIKIEGSLDIPRDEMPQIDAKNLYKFLQYLKQSNCTFENCDVDAASLKPSQNELDTDKADKIWNDGNALENPIIISDDNYVLDGHHRWFAVKRNSPETKIKCIKLNKSANSCIDLMHNFDKVEVRDIAGNSVQ